MIVPEVYIIKKEGYTGGSEAKKALYNKYYENVKRKLENKEISRSVFDGITRTQGVRTIGEGDIAEVGGERQPQYQEQGTDLVAPDNQSN